ncbi:MAG TPA: aminotransferase class V-fold PLP-dependent enzyme, partial [Candidatus Paceibacterota bacterium]
RQAHCKQAQDKKSGESVLPLVFHVDAAQAPLWLPLKVDSLGVDLMTLDAQKIQGPKGVGVLYRRRGVALAPIMRGGTQESGLRPGTENCVTAAGFAEALMIAQKDVEKRAEKIAAVRDYLLSEIQKTISDVLVNGTMTDRAPNNLNISISGLEGEVAVIALDAMGVAASTRSACSTEEENPSHVLAALGYDRTRALEAIRFTLLPDATKSDAKRIAQALKEVCRLYRKQNN